jgi:dolichol-phosphate mannosyltransferase
MSPSPLLSLVLPTYNERQNLPEAVRRIATALETVAWEAIIVDDDSPDGTAGACIEGLLSSSAPFIGVMDADLQHDETILPQMLSILTAGGAELVIGSRHVKGGSSKAGFSAVRSCLSRAATILGRRAFRADVSDIMSGFFLMNRECFDRSPPL